jgi:two-component system cell cycle sensor histidine kinase/response regulator CckA
MDDRRKKKQQLIEELAGLRQRVAESLRMEADLRESRQYASDVIDFLPDATFVIDREGRIVVWNRAMEVLSGVKAEDMVGQGDYAYSVPFHGTRRPILIDLVYAEDEVIAKRYPGFSRVGDSINAEVCVPAVGEHGAHVWAIAKPLYDADGNAIGAIESLRDITDRIQADRVIQKQKSELEAINAELSRAFETLGATSRGCEVANAHLIETQKELVAAHEELQRSEEKFSTVFRLTPFVVALSTVAEGRYVEVSDRFYGTTGYTPEETIGHTAFELNIWVNPDDRSRVLGILKEKGRVAGEEVQFRAKSGEVRDYLFFAELVSIAKSPYLLSVNVDITDRKQAEQTIRRQKEDLEAINNELRHSIRELEDANVRLTAAQQELRTANKYLRQSEEKFSKAFRLGPFTMTLSTLSDGKYVEISDQFLTLSEYTREEVIGRTPGELSLWVNYHDGERFWKALRRGQTIRNEEAAFQSRSGKAYTMLLCADVVTIFDTPHIFTIAIDITERRRAEAQSAQLEEQLQQAQKMETVGRLAGGIAHDFNNLLTAILGNAEIAMMSLDSQEPLYSRLAVVKKAAESAADLTKQLLAFSRKQIIEVKVIDLNELVERMRNILNRLIGEDVEVFTVTKAPIGTIKADPGQIEQIIVNLAVNARDAMPDGGTLILETADATLDDHYCQHHAEVVPGEYVMLSMSDTGCGMTEEVKKHLFEPFFTTKPKGKGTGLGLATVYGAVKQNQGSIEFYSVPNEGTTFKIYFPRVTAESVASPEAASADALPEGSETILLVEDDVLVREFALSVLTRLGYRVLQASTGEHAIALADQHQSKIHLLLTDVILPGMNGKVLSDAMRKSRPDTKVIFTSGYTEELIARHGVLEEGLHFIGKPYSAIALARKVREVLDLE